MKDSKDISSFRGCWDYFELRRD